MFVAPDLNVVISDVIPLDPAHSRVIGVSIPYICSTKKVYYHLIGILPAFKKLSNPFFQKPNFINNPRYLYIPEAKFDIFINNPLS